MPYRKMRPGKKHPNFQEIYDLDDLAVVAEGCKGPTVAPGLLPIALFGGEIIAVRLSDGTAGNPKDEEYDVLRYRYAKKVWKAAASACRTEEFSCLLPHWENRDDSFRMLVNDARFAADPVEQFRELLRSIADGGTIQVEDTYYLADIPGPQDRNGSVGAPGNRTFAWSEIEDLFKEVTLAQRELLLHEHLHRCERIDRDLMDACEKLDLEAVKTLVEHGANVNALDEDGRAPLARLPQIWEDEDLEKARELVRYLMDKGADIDLYGYGLDARPILVAAAMFSSPKWVAFLLELGADPNVNCGLLDRCDWGLSSSILQFFDEEDEWLETDDYDRQNRELVERAGARKYVDGWNPRRQVPHSVLA